MEGNEFAALRSLGPGRNSAGLAGVGQSVRNPKPRHLGGGLSVKDTMIGTGPPAPLGRTVKLLYEGTLKDGTVFDKKDKARSPFTFRLGLREVVAGMDKVGEGTGWRLGGSRVSGWVWVGGVVERKGGVGAFGARGFFPPSLFLRTNRSTMAHAHWNDE